MDFLEADRVRDGQMESSKEERVKWKADAELMEAKDPQQIPSQDNHDQCNYLFRYG